MKKKVFFILSSLTSGGSERVFWLLSQNIDKSLYEVTIVILNSKKQFFSTDLRDVRIIDLKTIRASRSFFKLYRLLKKERPHAVFATGGQINTLLALVSVFVHIPFLIARQSNIPDQRKLFLEKNEKGKIWGKFSSLFLRNFNIKRFNAIICQSDEMKLSLLNIYKDQVTNKLVVIPNPIVPNEATKETSVDSLQKKIIIVGRLVRLKGHIRLLEVFKDLPSYYTLSIAGEGPMRNEIEERIRSLNLEDRVTILGQVSQVEKIVARHDLLVSASFTEGFPNVVIEALSVGTAVVTFRVGGVSNVIIEDFNGYISEQGDLESFRNNIIKACNKKWDSIAIKNDINKRFSIEKIVISYQKLIA